MAQSRTAWICAEQADHIGLRAWARGTAALIAEWSPQSRQALRFADRAAALAPAGQSRIRVAAIEARTAARLGDAGRALTALQRLREAREETPVDDGLAGFGGLLTFPMAKQEYYLGGTYALLGAYEEAEAHASRAVGLYAAGPPEQRSYGDEALALVDLAVARLVGGDVAGAAGKVRQIVELPPEFRIRQLGSAVDRVTAALRGPAVARNSDARALLDLVRDYRVIDGGGPVPSLQ
jgi:tetratricopeptide (TPR) repeat protein